MKKYLIYILIILNISLLRSEFLEFYDSEYNAHIGSVARTDNFQTFVYDGYKFAVLEDLDHTRFFIISTDYSMVTGYRGTTTMGIIIKNDLTVESLEIIDSEETRGYISRLISMGFPQRFQNFKQGDDIEIITGATMTSEAILISVNECIEIFRPIIEAWILKAVGE
ncbi:MAG: FMN-binding protein [Candidatus Cloacimonetes bacterium]|nr:FMN-binding protein [Candidatus Cloacimonadota bacterium]